jgi:hypothetical protein
MNKNLKVILSALGVLLLLGGVGGGVYLVQKNQSLEEQASPATNISIDPASATKNPGDNFTLTVNIDTQSNSIVAADLDVVYDPSVLTVNSVTRGSFASGFETETPGTRNPGLYRYHIGTQDSTKALRGAGAFAVIDVTVKADAVAGARSDVSFGGSTKVAGIGEGGVNVLVGKSGAQVTVAGAVVSPSPVASTIASPIASASPAVSPSPVASASPAASASPVASASPAASPGGGTVASPSPVASSSPAASPRASSSPTASSSPAASASPAASPTVTIPTNGVITAGNTISGTAAPNSTVTITIRSQPITATVKADSAGKWSYKIPTTLENGSHTITIADSRGTITKSFTLTGGVVATASATILPETGMNVPTMFGLGLGVILLFAGLILAL